MNLIKDHDIVLIDDENVVSEIVNIVHEVREQFQLDNPIIRDDVFQLLQNKCTVLYYPLKDEQIDAFHLEKIVKGEKEQFVYINTYNKRERQAFSAAHELGHIWNVDSKVQVRCKLGTITIEESEAIINRFVAELLMPQEFFMKQTNLFLKKTDYSGSRIGKRDLIKMVVYLMDAFFTSYKSVVLRFVELGRMDLSEVKKILPHKDGLYVDSLINASQYTRLGTRTNLRSIDNIMELLNQARDKEVISEKRRKMIMDKFELKDVDGTDDETLLF